MTDLTMLDLFSGIGGFSLAGHWAGFRTVGFVEIDPFCQKVLARHWPEVPIHDDIRTLDGHAFGGVAVVTGGTPCQPFSVAGKRGGQKDDRHLWPEMARVVSEARPRWVVGENTPGIIDLALDDCLADLESLGYEAWTVVLPACAVGARHRRDRVWIIAADTECGKSGERYESPVFGRWRPSPEQAGMGGGNGVGSHAPDGGLRRGETSWQSGFAPLLGEADGDGRVPDDTRGGRHNATRAHWRETESRLRGGIDGLSTGVDRHRASRLKSLGNAIVPQVAYVMLDEIARYERTSGG